jgi:hypothetical protein
MKKTELLGILNQEGENYIIICSESLIQYG